jgi:hypothetical protein
MVNFIIGVQRKKLRVSVLDSSELGSRQAQGCCGKGNELSGYIKCVEFPE